MFFKLFFKFLVCLFKLYELMSYFFSWNIYDSIISVLIKKKSSPVYLPSLWTDIISNSTWIFLLQCLHIQKSTPQVFILQLHLKHVRSHHRHLMILFLYPILQLCSIFKNILCNQQRLLKLGCWPLSPINVPCRINILLPLHLWSIHYYRWFVYFLQCSVYCIWIISSYSR